MALMTNLVDRPQIAPIDIIYLATPHPTASNTSGTGASWSIVKYGTIRVRMEEIPKYARKQQSNDTTIATGMAFCGFFTSSPGIR